MELNLLDRAIAAVAPGWAADRALSRAKIQTLGAMQAMGGEMPSAGSASPRRFWNPRPRDARSDTMRQLPFQRGASRELARTSPIAVGAINTNIDRVVGTGLALSAQPNLAVLGWSRDRALAWKAKVQQEFSLWADSTECDIEGKQNFYQLQALVLRSALESGDCFSLLPDGERTATQPYELRIQVLEADRVGNPGGKADSDTVAGGVRLNAHGAPEAYHLYDKHPGSGLPTAGGAYRGEWIERLGRSGRRRMLHHFRCLRPGMPRGVPYLAPIIDCIKQISRYTEAEIMAAVLTAYLTVFIEAPGGNAAPVFDGTSSTHSEAPADIALGQGAVIGLQPGEKVQMVNPVRPNPNFEPFIQAVIKQMGIALGLPFELLTKQFNASYSASKAALLDAWVYFRSVRYWLSLSFCQPVFETWLAEAVAIGRVPAPGFFADPLLRWAYTRAAWPGDSMGSIDPKAEVEAYVEAIDARLMTRERAEWELFGSGWDETYDQKLAEYERLVKDGMLPTPKAGAAAPQQPKTTPPKQAPQEQE
ncbi:lambda family phage portal protein [Delftia tsuruhatensis]|uniref:Phage portal protein n=1 Tax=Delftia tsuruhatensis TaxID=180282 RepID=A0ABM6E3K3_9BURK|nr:phage portal protein [Delftia tsuruhatensis]AOV01858.1 phage portal protein [Delftia tsuruhatensis]KLO58272.1 lambda family phage portal protein [Delftia tsuruhatensis]